jgi:hypothetical protein|tara:strand:+ start:645 stop:791 length:147 start_codon:yes stop_codon:yes gene_type:complete
MIRKRVIFAVFLGVMTVLSGVVLTSGALIYYTGFLDGSKRCDAAGLVR